MKIAALGGGTGLSCLLSGLKKFTPDITAIVTVTDEGGSSGRLRRSWGVLPPGDFRNCLVGLAEDGADFGMIAAEGEDAPAGEEVQIFIAGGIPEVAALAADVALVEADGAEHFHKR